MSSSQPLPKPKLRDGKRSSPWLERVVLSSYLVGFVIMGTRLQEWLPSNLDSYPCLIYPVLVVISLIAAEFTVRWAERILGIR